MAAAVGAAMATEGAQFLAQTQARPSASASVTAYVGLGSNLDDPQARVRRALDALETLPDTRLVSASPLYATAPVGPQDQPDYVNAVARLATELTPSDLLAALLGIEAAQGRRRDGTRWGPRTLDLDLLLHGQARLALAGLHLPHPQIRRRAFVLIPLADVAPSDLEIPGQGILADLLRACPADGVRRIT
jgi:2-amino-4-hydroxy-6-hydroxymethyldihydropteridine diphosphokinase